VKGDSPMMVVAGATRENVEDGGGLE